jgi:acetolactate synthase small subunit
MERLVGVINVVQIVEEQVVANLLLIAVKQVLDVKKEYFLNIVQVQKFKVADNE